jgi:hypothetical protein
MKLCFIPSLLMFISAYFTLALIFIIKDLGDTMFLPRHPVTAAIIVVVTSLACAIVLLAASKIKSGLPVKVAKVWNKSGGQATLLLNLRDAVALARDAETHRENIGLRLSVALC